MTADRVGVALVPERRAHADQKTAALRGQNRMRALRRGARQGIAVDTANPPRPGGIGQHEHRRRRRLPVGLERIRSGHIPFIALLQTLKAGPRVVHKVLRPGVSAHRAKQVPGVEMQVFEGRSVAVVIDVDA